MRSALILILLFYSTSQLGQSRPLIEENVNLKKYRSVVISYYSGKRVTGSKKIELKNGKVNRIKDFRKSALIAESAYHRNKDGWLEYEIEVFNINPVERSDTIFYSYAFNDLNLLTEKVVFKKLFIENTILLREFYSDHDENGRARTAISDKYPGEFLTHYTKKREYDHAGNISEETISSELDGIEIIEYVYDKNNNVVEVRRKFIPEKEYPVQTIGGRSLYPVERYRYVYNKDQLWTEKYWQVEDQEYLIEKRKFK